MKTANEILEEKIWAKWGQTLDTLSNGWVNANTLIQHIKPQILEAMESYHEQNSHKHSVVRPALESVSGGETLATEAGTQSGCVWACLGCGQDTRETKWICCCSQECLKNWLASREASAEAL